jgi:hypothetical protein
LRGSEALKGQTLKESSELARAALGDDSPLDRRELVAMIARAQSIAR